MYIYFIYHWCVVSDIYLLLVYHILTKTANHLIINKIKRKYDYNAFKTLKSILTFSTQRSKIDFTKTQEIIKIGLKLY